MNLIKKATDAISGAKNIVQNKTGLFGTDYRTGVLNDFSIVTKAVFYVLKYTNVANKNSYEIIYKLPVQINPEHLNHAVARKVSVADFISGGDKSKQTTDSYSHDSIDIRLWFDVYDDYLAAGEFSGKEISLFNEKYTSLPKILEIGCDPNYQRNFKVLFKWGEIEYFGIITGVGAEYNAFSRWGSPLKCEATVSMTLEPTPTVELNGTMAEIAAYTKVSDNLNRVTLAGLSAAKEIGGIALGVVQSLR